MSPILLRKITVDYAPALVPLQRRRGSLRDGHLETIPQWHELHKGDAVMTEAPTKAPCWPDPPGWLDGATEILLPSSKYLRAHWDADILDIDDKNVEDTIIERKDTFQVRFRVQLEGRLWRCICGHWCFDVGFTAVGDGESFNLSDKLPAADKPKLRICDWKGCDTRCIEVCVTVPPGTIPVEHCGTMYEVGAKFELRCCYDCDYDCDDDGGDNGNGNGNDKDKDGPVAVAGHEALGQYMFV
jgi:hypothetical protein